MQPIDCENNCTNTATLSVHITDSEGMAHAWLLCEGCTEIAERRPEVFFTDAQGVASIGALYVDGAEYPAEGIR